MVWRNWPIKSPQWWLVPLCTVPVLAVMMLCAVAEGASRSGLIGIFAVCLPVLAFLWGHHNWLRLGDTAVRIGYMPLYWTTIPLDMIDDVTVRQIRPLAEFGGLGMKGHPASAFGLLLGGSPTTAVVIRTRDNKRYVNTFEAATRIGSVIADRAGVPFRNELVGGAAGEALEMDPPTGHDAACTLARDTRECRRSTAVWPFLLPIFRILTSCLLISRC